MARTILACALVLIPSLALAGDFEEGVAAYSKRDYDLAIARFTACIRANPRSAIAHHNRGHCYGDWSSSLTVWREPGARTLTSPRFRPAYPDDGSWTSRSGRSESL